MYIDGLSWRLDKDTLSSGLRQAKHNLLGLFIGPSPGHITAGVNAPRSRLISWPQIEPLSQDQGDIKRRQLICGRALPRFDHNSVHAMLQRRHALSGASYTSLYRDFLLMNPDQQRAIEKVSYRSMDVSIDRSLYLWMYGCIY